MSKPTSERDRVIADSGWGIKPDDQPANAAEAGNPEGGVFEYDLAEPDVLHRMLQQQRRGFNTANRIIIEPGRTTIVDVNGDPFVVKGLSYGSPHLIDLMKTLGAAFDPQKLRQLGPDCQETREYSLSRAWAWGAERTG